MVQTKEKIAARRKLYRKANKEKIATQFQNLKPTTKTSNHSAQGTTP